MKIIISPAKKMNVREDELDWANLPCFLDKAEELKQYIQGLSREEARQLWACNETIADLNYSRFQEMDLTSRLTAALLAYEGIQYQYMAPGIFEKSQWDYVQEHLRILSGFYGILRPLDGIVPYRLEMQAKVALPTGVRGLYDYWGKEIYEELIRESDVIINLASKEYSKAVEPYLTPDITWITCVFGMVEPDKEGRERMKIKATEAKMARGEMVRFLSENQIGDIRKIKEFCGLGYEYSQERSGSREYVFLKSKGERERRCISP